MRNSLKVSIVVPVYNAENYLKTSIESLINQSYGNIEIIIIDDGSTDKSLSICEEYVRKDSRIKLIHQDNRGLVYSRKVGLDNIIGDYVTFLDSDDYIELDTVEKIISNIDLSFPDVVAYGLLEDYENKTIPKKNNFLERLYKKEDIDSFILPCMISQDSFFNFGILPNLVCKWIKVSFLKNSMWSVSDIVSVGEDADFSYQFIAQADSIQIIESYPYHYCKRKDSMMWQQLPEEAIDALYNDLKKTFMSIGKYDVFEKQLSEYITFIKLLKNPQIVSSLKKRFENRVVRYAIYGAGGFGQAIVSQFGDNIRFLVDRDYQRLQKEDLEIKSIDELVEKQGEYDVIFIAILNVSICERVKKELRNRGIYKNIDYFKVEEISICQ